MKDRGRPIEAVLSQYERFVKPGFHKFILPMKKFADIIIPTSERTQGYLIGCVIQITIHSCGGSYFQAN